MNMRAKFQVVDVQEGKADGKVISEVITFMAVCGTDPFGPDGASEDNTYARYTPNASLTMTILNPVLFGQYKKGVKLYADFSVAPE